MAFSKDDVLTIKKLIADVLADQKAGQVGQQSSQDQSQADIVASKLDSISADVKASNVGQGQTQKDTVVTDYKDQDVGATESKKATIAGNVASSAFDADNMRRNKKIDGDTFSTAMGSIQGAIALMANAAATHYSTSLTNERQANVTDNNQKLRHADIAIAGQWGDIDKALEIASLTKRLEELKRV